MNRLLIISLLLVMGMNVRGQHVNLNDAPDRVKNFILSGKFRQLVDSELRYNDSVGKYICLYKCARADGNVRAANIYFVMVTKASDMTESLYNKIPKEVRYWINKSYPDDSLSVTIKNNCKCQ